MVTSCSPIRRTGASKPYVTTPALNCRRTHPGLFSSGSRYMALAQGTRAKGQWYVLGFSRCEGHHAAIVAVPRLIGGLLVGTHDSSSLGEAVWQDARLRVPGTIPAGTGAMLTGEPMVFGRRMTANPS